MRKLSLFLVSLLVLGVVGAFAAETLLKPRIEARLEEEITRSVQAEGVEVRVEGSVLLQGWRGRWERIQVQALSLERDGVRIEDVRAELIGVRVKVAEAVSKKPIPVESVRVTGTVSREYLNQRLPNGVSLQPTDPPTIEAGVTVLGRELSAVSVVSARYEPGRVVFTGTESEVEGEPFPLEASHAVTLPELPSGIEVEEVAMTSQGLSFEATASQFELLR